VEINSSFYRSHKPATYARWAASVPLDFRFAVKLPREITHVRKLVSPIEPLDRFFVESASLGDKRGPLLMQLPPSLSFDEPIASAFFDAFRARFDGLAVCEPRHASWFTARSEALLSAHRIARAAADPAPAPGAARPGGWSGLEYRRLHGSPRIYYSAYESERLDAIAAQIRQTTATTEHWCILDNTALGEATSDALALSQRMGQQSYGEGTGSNDE
jgi:uncharacterized protein YecE (DUF72 family)